MIYLFLKFNTTMKAKPKLLMRNKNFEINSKLSNKVNKLIAKKYHFFLMFKYMKIFN